MAHAHVPSLAALCPTFPCPHLRLLPRQESRARGFIVLHARPKTMPFYCFTTLFHLRTLFFFTNTPTQTALKFKHQVHSCPRHRGQKSTAPRPLPLVFFFWKVIHSFFLCHGATRGWLAPVQRGVRWRRAEPGPVCFRS